jgi:hypothetical protein
MKIVSRPKTPFSVQTQEFERPKKGGRMQPQGIEDDHASGRIAQRDLRQLLAVLKEGEEEER